MASLTDSDRKVLSLAWQCFESPPKIDFEKMATLGGWKNKASAQAMLNATKKKLAATTTPGDETTSKKRSAADADADDAETKPAKKARGRKSKAEVAAALKAEDEQGDDTAAVKKEASADLEDGELGELGELI